MRVSDFSDATLAVGYFGLCLRLVKFRTISIDVRYRRVTIRDRDSEARYELLKNTKNYHKRHIEMVIRMHLQGVKMGLKLTYMGLKLTYWDLIY